MIGLLYENTIKEFIEPTNKEKQGLWQKAVFVFDTNVLLNLYRYSAKTRKSLLAAFENFKDRVWIPYQVAYEYMRKRCEVIYETVQRYEQFKKEMENFTNKAVETLRLTSSDEEVSELKRYLFKWLDSNKDRNLLVVNADEDEILDKILTIFDGRVGSQIDDKELNVIKEEGEKRYKQSIPPGFKDDKKKKNSEDDNNAYGDLIIWKQIIKYAKENGVGIVYVTHDQKEDWWNITKGKTIGPRIELRKEFITETNQEFHMYSMDGFINTYNKMNENQIDKSAIIQNRILRRRKIMEDIENKYQKQGIELPENIQFQYDNTKVKREELEEIYEKKLQELNVLKQTLSETEIINSL